MSDNNNNKPKNEISNAFADTVPQRLLDQLDKKSKAFSNGQDTEQLTLSDPSLLAAFMPKTIIAPISQFNTSRQQPDDFPPTRHAMFDEVPNPRLGTLDPQHWRMYAGQTATEALAHCKELIEISKLSLLADNAQNAEKFYAQAIIIRNLLLTDVGLARTNPRLYADIRSAIDPKTEDEYNNLGFFGVAAGLVGLRPVTKEQESKTEQKTPSSYISKRVVDDTTYKILNLVHQKFSAVGIMMHDPLRFPVSRSEPSKFVPFDELINRAKMNAASAMTMLGIVLETHADPKHPAHIFAKNILKGIIDPSKDAVDIGKITSEIGKKYRKGMGVPQFNEQFISQYQGPKAPDHS